MQLASASSAQMGVTASMASIVLNTRCTCSIRRNFYVNNCLTISFPKWRQESIKAYGNAWVPQVAYEIFRAIEAEENK